MSKISLSNLSSGFRSSNKLNENFQKIRDAIENTISRDGSAPNQMMAPLDMNSQRIVNIGAPVNNTDAVRLIDVINGIQGPVGPQGPQGDVGPQGPTGATGPQGPQGPQGLVGPQGPTGATGPQGPQGTAGVGLNFKASVANSAALPPTGNSIGDARVTEDTGNAWSWGGSSWTNIGLIRGPIGPTGATGATGPQGPAGAAATIPDRLGTIAQAITDWNNATANGFYMGQGAANAPNPVPWYLGFTVNHGSAGWCTQEVWAFADNTNQQNLRFRRDLNNGVWTAWHTVYDTAAEIVGLTNDYATLSSVSALRAATWANGRPAEITLVSNYVIGDQGGRFRVALSDTTSPDNGGTVIVDASGNRWWRQDDRIRASHFGAHPSATATENRNAIQAAINWAAQLGGGTVDIDIPGYYNIAKRTTAPTDRALNVPKGVNIRGLGTGAPQDSGVALVTLQPSEDMTLFIAGNTMVTQTCTISNASPGVITAPAHGKVAGDVVYFATTGNLPAPLLPMFPYYVLAAGLTADSFRIGLSGSTPAINTTTSGSGVHTLISATSLTHSFGMSDINIYGGAVANVQCLIAESTVGAEFDNVLVEPGDPTKQKHGWLHAANSLAAWLNQYTRLQVGGFSSGVGAAHFGSDSSYSQCTFSGCGVNHRLSEGSITIDGGQNENGTLLAGGIGSGRGLEIVPSGTGRNVVIDICSRFVANKIDIYIYDSPTGTGFNARLRTNGLHHDCRETNISVGSNINNVTFDGTFNEMNPAGQPHITWRGPSTNNLIKGNFSEPPATRFSNLPPDALVVGAGNGQQNRMTNLQIAPSTQPVLLREARFECLGSDTVLGQANVAARFGLARGSAGFDSALLVGALNGNAPFIGAVDGEGTTASNFALNFRGTQHISMTTGLNSFQVPSVFNGSGSFQITVNRPTASDRFIAYATGSLNRWAIGVNSNAESGSNTGSNFSLYAYTDAGAFSYEALSVRRSDGLFTVNGILQPSTDNARTLGAPSNRWSIVYAATGTINTSDAREKTEIKPLNEAERRVAKAIREQIGTYQWLDAVETKGADKARLHIGVTAQAVQAAFEAEGLDPWRYAILCADEIFEVVETKRTVTNEDGTENEITDRTERPKIGPDGKPLVRLGVRYDQLNMFIMAVGFS